MGVPNQSCFIFLLNWCNMFYINDLKRWFFNTFNRLTNKKNSKQNGVFQLCLDVMKKNCLNRIIVRVVNNLMSNYGTAP